MQSVIKFVRYSYDDSWEIINCDSTWFILLKALKALAGYIDWCAVVTVAVN